jgi:Tol biopolymer transport system component
LILKRKGKTFTILIGLFSKIIQMKNLPFLSWLLLLLSVSSAFSQAPATDIFVFDIALINGRVNFQRPLRITDRAGYDNQPGFLPDSKSLLFSSDRGDSSQTDIYQYDLVKRECRPLTQTPESEYSPRVIPGKHRFSVVRVEADGETQRIWQFPFKTTPVRQPKVLMPEVDQVGYYAWADASSLVVFRLPEPFRLELRRLLDGELQSTIARRVGRSLQVVPDEYALTYVDKSRSDQWMIKKLGLITGKTTEMVETLPGEEDFCWSPEGYMLMGSGGKLYMFMPELDEEWRFVGDLGVGDFYRMAVSPDGSRLAVVVYRE